MTTKPTNDEALDQAKKLIETHGAADGDLLDVDDNAFALIGYVRRRQSRASWPSDAIEQYSKLMTSGDYDLVLALAILATGDVEDD